MAQFTDKGSEAQRGVECRQDRGPAGVLTPVPFEYSRALYGGTTDIGAGQLSVVGVPCIMGCLAASLASTHQMHVVTSIMCLDTAKWSLGGGGAESPWLRTPGLHKSQQATADAAPGSRAHHLRIVSWPCSGYH